MEKRVPSTAELFEENLLHLRLHGARLPRELRAVFLCDSSTFGTVATSVTVIFFFPRGCLFR